MLIKIVIIVTIIFLLRSHLAFLKPYWQVLAGFVLGAIAGWLMVDVLINLKVNLDFFKNFGCPHYLVKPLFAAIGGLVVVKPLSTVLRRLFPYRLLQNSF